DPGLSPAGQRGFFTYNVEQKAGLAEGHQFYLSRVRVDKGTSIEWSNFLDFKIGEPYEKGISCAPDGVSFDSQWSLDHFEDNYPGCTVIGGNITIGGPDIANLYGLREIKTIGGSLEIRQTLTLNHLEGLESLDSCWALFIHDNPELIDLQGLESLRAIGPGGLQVSQNQALVNLDGLNNLQHVDGDFALLADKTFAAIGNLQSLGEIGGNMIIFNDRYDALLVDLLGLEGLTTIGGNFDCHTYSLQSLEGLENLRAIGGHFDISRSPSLFHLSALQNLRAIGAELTITETGLAAIGALDSLTSVGGKIAIVDNPQLTQLIGLNNLRRANSHLIIQRNPLLFALFAFQSLDTIVGYFTLSENRLSNGLGDLNQLAYVGGSMEIIGSEILDLHGLENLRRVGHLNLWYNHKLENLQGLENLQRIEGWFQLSENATLKSLDGLDNLDSLCGLALDRNPALADISALGGVNAWGGCGLWIDQNAALPNLHGLENMSSLDKGELLVARNPALEDMTALSDIRKVGSFVYIWQNASLKTLGGLNELDSIGERLTIDDNASLTSLNGLRKLKFVPDIYITNNPKLIELNGLDQLNKIGGSLKISRNDELIHLHGLENLDSIGIQLELSFNPSLESLLGLRNLKTVGTGRLILEHNDALTECAIEAICAELQDPLNDASVYLNGQNCNTASEIEADCKATPVRVIVQTDPDGDCLPDMGPGLPVPAAQVEMSGSSLVLFRPTGVDGTAYFKIPENGAGSFRLLQFPTSHWAVCQDVIQLASVPGNQDTLQAIFLLKPLVQCPEPTTKLSLPANFRGCLTNSDVQVSVQNTGDVLAEDVRTAIVMPPVFELVSVLPALAGQNGDTLFFNLNDLKPFETAQVQLSVRTKCDTFLLGHTLCWEAFSQMSNACPTTAPAFSEISLSAKCVGDTLVRFTLKNIGTAPTITPHEYRIFRNTDLVQSGNFNLDAGESKVVNVTSESATWRMEATKRTDGSHTAVALENCGGLTPGQVNMFWLETGPPEYDFACRQVIGSFDPNEKSALPTGVGNANLLPQNRTILYTIDFQNTGTDTAFRVQLRDILDDHLDVTAFKPLMASHPYSWEIRGNLLEVLFSPITLPDSNINEPASHGFFSFEIDQKPALPEGTIIENTANIVFDFNPPIVTNTVHHRIGNLIVTATEPQLQEVLWEVLGNPTRTTATFIAKKNVEGEKTFVLFGAEGKLLRQEKFDTQSFDFQRNALLSGLYYFTINDLSGQVFSGKIVIAD
ncbi:MAG: hypothetical protein H7246_05070, partial [Phycisphaerae bacterium]|nr:hypothetical protein [Saprospiraceae bacterium]